MTGSGLVVVVPDGGFDVRRRDAVGAHAQRIEPDAHRQRLAAQDVHRRHAVDGGQHRPGYAQQVIRDAGQRLAGRRGESGVDHSDGAGRLAHHHRIVGIFGQQVTHLIDLGQHLRQRGVGIGVQAQVGADGAAALFGRGSEVFHALRGGDGLRQRGGHKALHQVSGGAWVLGGDGDHRAFDAGILAQRQVQQRARADQRDQQGKGDGQDGTANKEIGK
ncbi:hypothetical protein D3C85_1005940 [compost metagenome]